MNRAISRRSSKVPRGSPTGTTISGDHWHLWNAGDGCAELLLTNPHVTLSGRDLRALSRELLAMSCQLEPAVPPPRSLTDETVARVLLRHAPPRFAHQAGCAVWKNVRNACTCGGAS